MTSISLGGGFVGDDDRLGVMGINVSVVTIAKAMIFDMSSPSLLGNTMSYAIHRGLKKLSEIPS